MDRTAEHIGAAGVGVRRAADAKITRTGLGDRKSVGADGVADDPRKVGDGTAGITCTRPDVEDRGITAGDVARETEVLGVRRRI